MNQEYNNTQLRVEGTESITTLSHYAYCSASRKTPISDAPGMFLCVAFFAPFARLRPWLIEVNASPSMARDSHIDRQVGYTVDLVNEA